MRTLAVLCLMLAGCSEYSLTPDPQEGVWLLKQSGEVWRCYQSPAVGFVCTKATIK